jgi:hypothetical protein
MRHGLEWFNFPVERLFGNMMFDNRIQMIQYPIFTQLSIRRTCHKTVHLKYKDGISAVCHVAKDGWEEWRVNDIGQSRDRDV